MSKFYFTFGFEQKHENGFHIIEVEDMEIARKEMFEKFGTKWSMAYTAEQWFDKKGVSQQERFNLHEVK